MAASSHGHATSWCDRDSARYPVHLFLCLSIGASAASANEINIAPYCKIRSTPYIGAAIAYLTDAKLVSPADNTLMLAAPLCPVPVVRGDPVPGFVEDWPGTGLHGWGGGSNYSNPGTGGVGGVGDGFLILSNTLSGHL